MKHVPAASDVCRCTRSLEADEFADAQRGGEHRAGVGVRIDVGAVVYYRRRVEDEALLRLRPRGSGHRLLPIVTQSTKAGVRIN
jgi:hypothetical protein